MGTAPLHDQDNKGLDDKQINLGVVQPGEKLQFSVMLAQRRLTNQAKFMHSDLGRYWYSMAAEVTSVSRRTGRAIRYRCCGRGIDKNLTGFFEWTYRPWSL